MSVNGLLFIAKFSEIHTAVKPGLHLRLCSGTHGAVPVHTYVSSNDRMKSCQRLVDIAHCDVKQVQGFSRRYVMMSTISFTPIYTCHSVCSNLKCFNR
jgi:hypothetical protein